jgi:hypothetical protein
MRKTVALLALALAASAAVAPTLTLEQLAAKSEIIAHARVGRSWSSWDPAHKYIWTHHELLVLDPIRGAAGPVVVSEPGGFLNGVGMRVSGTVEYTTGEEAILFLYRTPIGFYRAAGQEQGKLAITRDRRVRTGLRANTGLADFKSRLRQIARTRP